MELVSIGQVCTSSSRIGVNLGGDSWVILRKDKVPEFDEMESEVWKTAHADERGQYIEFDTVEERRINLDTLLRYGESPDSDSQSGSIRRIPRILRSTFAEGIAAV